MTTAPLLHLLALSESIEAGCRVRGVVREVESDRARRARARLDREQRRRALAMFGRVG